MGRIVCLGFKRNRKTLKYVKIEFFATKKPYFRNIKLRYEKLDF